MSATYNPAQIDPATGDPISAVRWLLQDTDTSAADISDAELNAIYTTHDSALPQDLRVYRTGAALAQALHRRYAKQATFSSDGTSVQLSERARSWADIASSLTLLAGAVESGGVLQTVVYARRDPAF
jgi:hypothetical protein